MTTETCPRPDRPDRGGRPPAVSLRGLTKRYGARTAVDRLTIDVPAGVVAGFVGPNGAGKTTTMAMLLGLVAPTEGDGTVLGEPLAHPARTSAASARSSRGRRSTRPSAASATSPSSRPRPATTRRRSRRCSTSWA